MINLFQPQRAFVAFSLASASLLAFADDDVVRSEVFVSKICPVSQVNVSSRESSFASVVALKVLGGFAEGAIKTAAAVLKEAAKDDSITVNATNSTYLFHSDNKGGVGTNPDFFCLVFFKGRLGAWNEKRTSSNLAGFSKNKGLRDLPDIYYEASMQLSPDGSFFRLRPQIVRYSDTGAKGWGAKSDTAILTISFGVPASEKPFGTAIVPLPRMPAGRDFLAPNDFKNETSQWIPLPAIADDDNASHAILAKEGDLYSKRDILKQEIKDLQTEMMPEPSALAEIRAAACKLAETSKVDDAFCPIGYKKAIADYTRRKTLLANQAAVARKNLQLREIEKAILENEADASDPDQTSGVPLKPIDLDASLVETVKGNKFLKILAQAVDDVAPSVATSLRQRIDPDEKQIQQDKDAAARLTKIALSGDLETAALTELTNAQNAEAILADLPLDAKRQDRAKLESEFRLAKLRANIAFRKLGQPDPYPGSF